LLRHRPVRAPSLLDHRHSRAPGRGCGRAAAGCCGHAAIAKKVPVDSILPRLSDRLRRSGTRRSGGSSGHRCRYERRLPAMGHRRDDLPVRALLGDTAQEPVTSSALPRSATAGEAMMKSLCFAAIIFVLVQEARDLCPQGFCLQQVAYGACRIEQLLLKLLGQVVPVQNH
jgi:hypothetical protein